MSNITAGTAKQIEAFVEHVSLLSYVYFLMKSENKSIRAEAILVITNLVSTTTDSLLVLRIANFENASLLERLVEGLRLRDVGLILEIIQSLDVLLSLDAKFNLTGEDQIAYKLEIAGGLDELSELEKHPNLTVYEVVDKLSSKYFGDNDQDEEYE